MRPTRIDSLEVGAVLLLVLALLCLIGSAAIALLVGGGCQ